MAFPVVAAVSPRSVLFTTPDGKTHRVPEAHPRFQAVVALARMADLARRNGDEAAATAVMRLLPRLAGVAAAMPARAETQCHGPVEADEGGVVRVDGEPVDGPVAERILWALREGLDATPLMAFLANLLENPSKRPVEDLFDFVDGRGLAITEDGHLLGYERVRADYRDTRSGATDNTPGRVVQVRRNRVEEDPSRPCAVGLRFGPYPHYDAIMGIGEDRIVAVKVNPRDVVAVPTIGLDGVRCCRYEVLFDCTPAAAQTAAAADVAARHREGADPAAPATEPQSAPAPEPLVLTPDMMVPAAASPAAPAGKAAVDVLKAAAAALASGPDRPEEAVRKESFVFGPDRPAAATGGAPEPTSETAAAPATAASPQPRKRRPWPLRDSTPAGMVGA